ncbi:RPS7 [Scenedesmus sp. PABB004]|nr:RPS7 [Scenedesmus sp. PABB004]
MLRRLAGALPWAAAAQQAAAAAPAGAAGAAAQLQQQLQQQPPAAQQEQQQLWQAPLLEQQQRLLLARAYSQALNPKEQKRAAKKEKRKERKAAGGDAGGAAAAGGEAGGAFADDAGGPAERDVTRLVLAAIDNVTPVLDVRPIRTATKVSYVPGLMPPRKARSLALHWLVRAADARAKASAAPYAECLALELLLAFQKKGAARQKRDDLHKLALANRANAAQEEGHGGAACAADVAALQRAVELKEAAAAEAQREVAALKADLSAATGKLSQAQTELNKAQTELADAGGKLSALEAELAGTKGKLQRAEEVALEGAATCKRSLTKVESKLSEHAARLEELKTLEDALLPLWLSRRVDAGVAFASAQWAQLRESDLAAQVAEKVAPHVEQAMAATKPARDAAAVHVARAKEALAALPVADAVASARRQLADVERELTAVVGRFVADRPALAGLADPVALQLVVYSIMGLPALLLAALLLAVAGGPSKPAAGGGGKAGAKKPAAGGKKAAAGGGTAAKSRRA